MKNVVQDLLRSYLKVEMQFQHGKYDFFLHIDIESLQTCYLSRNIPNSLSCKIDLSENDACMLLQTSMLS